MLLAANRPDMVDDVLRYMTTLHSIMATDALTTTADDQSIALTTINEVLSIVADKSIPQVNKA